MVQCLEEFTAVVEAQSLVSVGRGGIQEVIRVVELVVLGVTHGPG